MAHLLHKRDCASAWRGSVSNARALEFESALERDTSMNSRLTWLNGWIRVVLNRLNPSEEIIHLPRSLANTRQQEDASEMLEEYDDGHAMEWSCVYVIEGHLDRIQEKGLHANPRAGLMIVLPVKSWTRGSLCRDGCGIWRRSCYEVKSAWYPMWNRRQLGVEQRRIQLHEGWKEKLVNAEHSEAWQEALLHERFSASEEGHSSITCSWRCSACKLWRQWGALQKVWMQKCGANRPEIRTWRWYQIWRDTSISAEKTIWWTWWAGPGLWDQHARSEEAVIECRAKYSSPTMIQLRTWTRNSVDLWDVFKSRARHLQEAEVQRSHQWDNQEWSRERDVTQRQVLQVIVSAQGAARRDCRFQAEHVEHGKIRTQCKGCSACDRQSGKTRRWRKDDRPSQCGSCFVVVALVVAFVVVAFWPYVVSCSRSSCPPALFLLPSSPLSSLPLRISILLPATIWHPSDIPRSTEHVCLHNFAFIRTLIWCSHLI